MSSIYLYLVVMAVVTYLVRLLPLTLIRKEIKNTYIRSFLYYVPYVTLAVMIFPAILDSTASTVSGLVGFLVAVILAYSGRSLFTVSIFACLSVYIVELVI
ncbi:AzlD domain-containing protein [Oceanobacillus senegalensis]|uniref:AzlD domain-containing protein n=1 Tax=Oceanobacillus senegalensis TaxID=1936063 RepID=UPI001FE46D8E|nr:AzlD domain-containing protein [Oceanobacillus senegalensis]